MKNDIQRFIKEIIKKAELDKMPQDFLDEYNEKLTMEAQKRLGLASVSELKPEEIEEFTKLIEESNNDSEKINEYLTFHIENFEEKMAKALAEFGNEIIKNAEKLRK